MKKFKFIIAKVFILFLFIIGCSANSSLPLLVDNAKLLSPSEAAEIDDLLKTVSYNISADTIIVTTNNLDGKSAKKYAEDFFDENGYGFGSNNAGIILLISLKEPREYYIIQNNLFSDYELELIDNSIFDELYDSRWADAFTEYANFCNKLIESNVSYENEERVDYTSFIIPSLIIGFIISLIIVSVMKSKLKTVKAAKNAASYVVKDSLNLTLSSDRYLYTNVTRTPRSNNNSSSRASIGGRSGRGGRF